MSLLFLDTEFNEFGGELISMALVSADGREWYQVYDFPGAPGEWVAKHVIPHLDKAPIGWTEMQGSLAVFLSQFNGCEIIADWPADFEHLCRMMTGIGAQAGFMMPIECTMRLLVSPELFPDQPHNALSDARALRDWYMRDQRRKTILGLGYSAKFADEILALNPETGTQNSFSAKSEEA